MQNIHRYGLGLLRHTSLIAQQTRTIRLPHFEAAAIATSRPKVFDTDKSRQLNMSSSRLFVLDLLEKAAGNCNNLPPPPILAEKCCEFYKQLDKNGKLEFFDVLAKDYDVDRENAVNEARKYIDAADNRTVAAQIEKSLQYFLEPKYNMFLDRIHQLPNGLKFLVDLRADLLDIMGPRGSAAYNAYSRLEQDIQLKLKKYVLGFLKLERITWESSSAALLEKICSYEAVHQVKDWKDIKRRLGPDRRVYAFFENNMPNEPLVFVHVALLPAMANSVQAILEAPDPVGKHDFSDFTYAICYSITTQKGLGGINLGNYLIKQAVGDLQKQFPLLKVFATLSPMPGFRQWLNDNIDSDSTIQAEFGHVYDLRNKLSRFNSKDQQELKVPLMRLCSRYILTEKRAGKHALDPVANFHLRNGACAHQIHWQADTSEKGIGESFGIMINYNYIANRLEINHQLYQKNGTIPISEPNYDADKKGEHWLSQRINQK